MNLEVCKDSIPDDELNQNHVKHDTGLQRFEDSQNLKRCFGCGQLHCRSNFTKNKTKTDGLESSCKKCVSKNKAQAYAKKTKKSKSIARGESGCIRASALGEIDEETILSFAKLFEEIYRGLKYEGKI